MGNNHIMFIPHNESHQELSFKKILRHWRKMVTAFIIQEEGEQEKERKEERRRRWKRS